MGRRRKKPNIKTGLHKAKLAVGSKLDAILDKADGRMMPEYTGTKDPRELKEENLRLRRVIRKQEEQIKKEKVKTAVSEEQVVQQHIAYTKQQEAIRSSKYEGKLKQHESYTKYMNSSFKHKLKWWIDTIRLYRKQRGKFYHQMRWWFYAKEYWEITRWKK